MWKSFKAWLCKAEYQRMQEWFDYERKILHEEYLRREDYLDNKYRMVMHQNKRMEAMMLERAMLDPNPSVLFSIKDAEDLQSNAK